MSGWLEVGERIPDLTLPADDGDSVRLRDLKGKTTVVYFYPKDDTPGCTREACAFRDRSAELKKLGVQVFGITADDLKSHGKFRDKYSLNFPLLSDVDHRAAEAFGAWQEKNNYGKKYWGIVRSTFLIDSAGVVLKVWPKVNVDGHDAAVIEAVRSLDRSASSEATELKSVKKTPAKRGVGTAITVLKKKAAKASAKTRAKKKTAPKAKKE